MCFWCPPGSATYDVLCELEGLGEWDRVPLQTEWKLENCYDSGGRDGSQQQSTKQSAINQNIKAKSYNVQKSWECNLGI